MRYSIKIAAIALLFLFGILVDQKLSLAVGFGQTELIFILRLYGRYFGRILVWTTTITLLLSQKKFVVKGRSVVLTVVLLLLLFPVVYYGRYSMLVLINYGIVDFLMMMDWLAFISSVIISKSIMNDR